MLNRWTMIAAAVMTVGSLSGPLLAPPASAQSSPVMTLDANANGGVTTIAPGAMFAVALPENPSSGYKWQVQPLDVPVVGVVGDRFVAPSPGEQAEGTRLMTFSAIAPGTSPLIINLQGPGGQPSPSNETFIILVTVSSDHGG